MKMIQVLVTTSTMLLLSSLCLAQQSYKEIKYQYDAAGNRIIRQTTIILNKKAAADTIPPIQTTKTVIDTNKNVLNNSSMGSLPQVSIYPNPTIDQVKINLQGFNTYNEAKLIVSDAYGKELITTEKFNQTILIDLSPFSSGVYLVHLIVNNQKHVYRINKI